MNNIFKNTRTSKRKTPIKSAILGSITLALILCGTTSISNAQETTQTTNQPKTLRVSAAQIPVTRDIGENVKTILRAIGQAAAENADILLTPEGSLSGYTPNFDQDQVNEGLKQILDKAAQHGLALALGTCFIEPEDGCCYNQIRFYDNSGKFLGFHSKALLCGSMTDPPKGEIEHYATSPLKTFRLNGIVIGGLICKALINGDSNSTVRFCITSERRPRVK